MPEIEELLLFYVCILHVNEQWKILDPVFILDNKNINVDISIFLKYESTGWCS